MKIEVYVLCLNEMDILPWAVGYWRLFADKVTVFDNGSTDGSLEYLSQFDWITVKHYITNEGTNDVVMRTLKNNCWKGTDADWIVVCDMDEMLFSPEGVRTTLAKAMEKNIDIIYPQWYTLVSDAVPAYDGQLLHRIRPMWTPKPNEAKPMIFQPTKFKEINYCCGAHYCQPVVNDEYFASHNGAIYCLHTERRLSPEYYIRKTKEAQARRSQINLKYGFGKQYEDSEEKMLAMLEQDKNNAVKLDL